MAENSKIEWCHNTFNPWIGCTKVSEGCAHCYAENSTRARVLRHHGQETWGKGAQRSRTSSANWKEPLKWNTDAFAAQERCKFNHAYRRDQAGDNVNPDGSVQPLLTGIIERRAA